MWHKLLEEGTGKCLHRASSAEQPAEVSHFVRITTLSSRLIMHGTLYWRVSLNAINAENETKPEMIAWQWHNTSAHLRTCYKGKVQLSLQLASLYYNCFWCTCKSLRKKHFTFVVEFTQMCLNLLFSFPSPLYFSVFLTSYCDLLDKGFFQYLHSLTCLCWLE